MSGILAELSHRGTDWCQK